MERITSNSHTTADGGSDATSRMHMHAGPDGSDESGRRDARSGGAFDAIRDRAETLTRAVGRTDPLSVIRNKPLAATGLAFAAGFVVAAMSVAGDRHWAIARVRRHLRTALIGGLAAALADELKDLLEGDEGIGSILHGLLPNDGDDSDEHEA